MESTGREALEAGREALRERRWEDAKSSFQAAIAEKETGAAFEGLASACYWLHDDEGALEARERAHQLYRDAGDVEAAARVAAWLAIELIEFRGQIAAANGWMQRARRMIEGSPESLGHGWLDLWEGHMALMLKNDAVTSRKLAERAAKAGRELSAPDLEMLAVALEGLALVSSGQVEEGMKRLDEATLAALAGELSDFVSTTTILCYMIDGCDRARDYERANEWCERIADFADLEKYGELFGYCRPHYAVVLMWRGEWAQAEEELEAAHRELSSVRPLMVTESVIRLAELRWRQGRWEEASALFKRAEQDGLSQLGRGEMALSAGDGAAAIDLADRHLRRIPANDSLERAPGLELMVRALVANDRGEDAEGYAKELRSIATDVGTDALKAAASLAEGMVAGSKGQPEESRRDLEDAVDLYDRCGAPFEGGRARIELARLLAELGRVEDAEQQAGRAMQDLLRIGASKEAERAEARIKTAGARAGGSPGSEVGLTSRETEVLQWLARGKSNQEIADELVLSIRTVERHISTIYEKIGSSGRTARAAATAYALKHDIA
jgi:DNA-binding CsgD family transcriptional regulator